MACEVVVRSWSGEVWRHVMGNRSEWKDSGSGRGQGGVRHEVVVVGGRLGGVGAFGEAENERVEGHVRA